MVGKQPYFFIVLEKCSEYFFKFVKCLRNSRQMLDTSAQASNQSVTLMKKNSIMFLVKVSEILRKIVFKIALYVQEPIPCLFPLCFITSYYSAAIVSCNFGINPIYYVFSII